MPYNVRLPDGRIVSDIPDDVSKEDARKQILESFPDLAAKQKRGWGEALTDVGASLATGVGQLAQLPGQVAELAGISKPEARDTGLQGLGRRLEAFGEEAKSPILKGKETMRAQKIAQAEGFIPEFTTAIKETVRDPALLTSFFTEQLPNLVGSFGGGMLARGATKALMSDTIKTSLGKAGAEKVLGKAGVSGAVGTGAIMQGADIGADTYETIYTQLREQGVPDDEANGIALSKARVAAIEAAGLSIGTAFLPGGTTIERALAGKGLPRAGGFTRGLVGEAASEAIEEGGGAFAKQVGVQEVFPETDLLKGVGAAAGFGALGGALFGGPAGAFNARAVKEAQVTAAETNEPQQVVLQLPYDERVSAPTTFGTVPLIVYPDGTTALQSEAGPVPVAELSEEEFAKKFEPQAVPNIIGKKDLESMGLGKATGKAFETLKQKILDKDINDPAQAQEVKEAIEAYGQRKGVSAKILPKLDAFLNRPEFQEPAKVEAEAVVPEPVVKRKRAKKTEVTPSIEEQAALQDELQAELEQTPETADVRGPTEVITRADELSVPMPSGREEPAAGTTEVERRRVVTPERAIGRADTGERAGERPLETPAVKLDPRQEKAFQKAAAEYIGQTKSPQQALEYLAGDLYAKENTTRANSFMRGLAPEQQEIVNRKIAELKQYEARGKVSLSRRNAEQKLRRAELAQNEEAIAAAQAELKKIKAKLPKVARDDVYGGVTPRLVMAVERGNTRAALQEIIDDNSGVYNILEKLIARRLLSVRATLPNIEVAPKEQIGADGEYNPFTDTVRIAQGEIDSHTVLHELTHGYLHSAIKKYEDGAFNKGVADLDRIYKYVLQERPDLANMYGMTNLSEFASEAMSNREFQRELAQIPTQRGNIFTEFARAVLRALGLSPTEKLSALADTLLAADRSLAFGRKIQEDVVTGRETVPAAKVEGKVPQNLVNLYGKMTEADATASRFNYGATKRTATMAARRYLRAMEQATGTAETTSKQWQDLNDAVINEYERQIPKVSRAKYDQIEAAAGYTGKRPEKTQPFQMRKVTPAEAKQGLNKFLNKTETMWFSSDAALANRIRQELEAAGTNWETIKEQMFKISTSQATHAEAVAMKFLEQGNVVYDTEAFKWAAKDDKNNWKSLIQDISALAGKYGISAEKMGDYAHQAFVAERLQGLSKSKKEFYSHKSPEQIKAGLEWYNEFPELKELRNKWNAIRKNAMDVAVQSGLYNEAQAEELLDAMDYVPFYRVEQLEAKAGPKEFGRGLLDFAKNYKIRGSEDEVSNVFDNMERWISYTVSRSVKNKTALNMYDIAKQLMPDEVKDLRQDERVRRDQNVVDLWVDGNRRKVEFKDPMFIYAFQGMEPVVLPSLRAWSAAANILRKNIVLIPFFSVSQLSQDSFAAMLSSGLKRPFKLPLEVAKEFTKTLMGTSQAAAALNKYGAVGIKDYSAVIARNEAEIAAGLKKPSNWQKVLSPLERIAMASDNAVRQAVYNLTLEEGGDKATAVERAFEIINFKRSGASGYVQILRQVIPFFGAYLQAQNVVYKTLTGKGISPSQKKEAQRILLSNAAKIAALAFVYTALVSDDEDYQNMDPTIRDRHLVIPGTGFMLPLRTDIFLFPKLTAEYAYQYLTDEGFTDGKKMRRGMADAVANAILSPTVAPQVAKPALEVFANYNTFTGRPIIGQGLENLPTAQQYSNYTSEFAKILGKAGIIAPVNIDHLVRGYFGTTGGLFLSATSSAINMGKEIPAPEKTMQDALATFPGLSAFFYREYGSAAKNDFYELRTEVDKAVNGFNRMKKRGQIEEAKEFMEEKKDLLGLRSQVNAINNQLAKIRARENEIYEAPESQMSAERKGEELRKLRELEKRALEQVYDLRQRAGF